MVLTLRHVIKKLYNLMERQDIHTSHTVKIKEIRSDKIIIEDKNTGQEQRYVMVFHTALSAVNCMLLRRGADRW